MYILAIDQGTTGTRAVLYDEKGRMVDKSDRSFRQIYPKPGWVEHDAMEIWQTVIDTVQELCARNTGGIAAIGITNQRETTVIWDRTTGQPIHHAIVWQCRRTADVCERLKPKEELVRRKTGLPVDAYFSGTKIKWLLEHAAGHRIEDLLFGTIDSWLIWKLTDGQVHATDYTNASRTMIFNIIEKRWDEELCQLLNIPLHILPAVRRSIDDYGRVTAIGPLVGVPIYGVAGDQQAALFGQACFSPGQIKNTYGTGCFLLMNTGDEAIFSNKGMLTTLAVAGDGSPCYALEGSVFIAGAAIQWLRDELRIIQTSKESEAAALAVPDNAGVYMVPAFVGLGAPHWDMQARGVIVGLTRGANRNHIVRAALEAMAYQSYDVLTAMAAETGMMAEKLAVDGGAVDNNFLLQFQADILNMPVVRPAIIESTSLGVAFMAGLKVGMWESSEELSQLKMIDREFRPAMSNEQREQLLSG
ncbi:MAG: glycerol kinase GlpK, partial [candidate division KSB1 bacterium]|nr:glycerol kinase GlpK [candidate division KSB1 bacterium]